MSPRPELFKTVSTGASEYSLPSPKELSAAARNDFAERSAFSDQISVRSLGSVRSSPPSLCRGNSTSASGAGTPATPGTPLQAGVTPVTPSAAGIIKEGAGGEFYAGTYFPTIEEEDELRGSLRGDPRRKQFKYPDSEDEDESSWYHHAKLGTKGPLPGLRRSNSENTKQINAPPIGMPSSVTSNTSYQTPAKRPTRVASVGHGHTRSDAGVQMVRSGSADPNFPRPPSSAGMSSTSSVYSRADTPELYGRQGSLSPTVSPTGEWDGTIKSRKEGQRVCLFASSFLFIYFFPSPLFALSAFLCIFFFSSLLYISPRILYGQLVITGLRGPRMASCVASAWTTVRWLWIMLQRIGPSTPRIDPFSLWLGGLRFSLFRSNQTFIHSILVLLASLDASEPATPILIFVQQPMAERDPSVFIFIRAIF